MPCTHMICCVHGCKKDPNSSLFRAPSPRKSWDLYCAWVKATGNPKFQNFTTLMPEKVYICQKHFKDEEVNLMKIRRKTCVPTLHLPEPLQSQDNIDVGVSANGTYEISLNSVPTIETVSIIEKSSSEPRMDEISQQIVTSCMYSVATQSSSLLKKKLPASETTFMESTSTTNLTIDLLTHMLSEDTVLPTKKSTFMVLNIEDDRVMLVCDYCSNCIQNSKFVCCRNCEKSFHSQCVSVQDNALEILSESSNFAWFCDSCKYNLFVPKHDVIYIEAIDTETNKQVNDCVEQEEESECLEKRIELETESQLKKSEIELNRSKIGEIEKSVFKI